MVLVGCGGTPAHRDGADHAGDDSAGQALPSRHVHAVAHNPANGHVYLATHDGLFRLKPGAGPARVGPVIDLMGFTVAGPDHFYASGHPGPGTALPNPVGLIESIDGGQTWTALSRQGRSDFHTLTVSPAGIVGFDGNELAATGDGRSWRTLTPPVTPHAAAASPDGTTLLVSGEAGLTRSTDQGRTWTRVATPLPLQLLAWADGTHVIGIAPDGRSAVSNDAGTTWRPAGSVGGAPHAVTARPGATGVEVLAVTATGLARSVDGGATFAPYRP
jgi:hypothetical protein